MIPGDDRPGSGRSAFEYAGRERFLPMVIPGVERSDRVCSSHGARGFRTVAARVLGRPEWNRLYAAFRPAALGELDASGEMLSFAQMISCSMGQESGFF